MPEVLELIVDSWQTFTPKPGVSELEVPITRRFRVHLVKRKNYLRTLPIRIERESVEDDLITGVERGRIDIRFTHAMSCREEAYFAFECKRLGVPSKSGRKSLAAAYVTQGMTRFVMAQYSEGHKHSGMIGYVIDGRLSPIMDSLNSRINSDAARLGMIKPARLEPSRLAKAKVVKETRHRVGKRRFRLHHILLACR